jgi:hypothetical protein
MLDSPAGLLLLLCTEHGREIAERTTRPEDCATRNPGPGYVVAIPYMHTSYSTTTSSAAADRAEFPTVDAEASRSMAATRSCSIIARRGCGGDGG